MLKGCAKHTINNFLKGNVWLKAYSKDIFKANNYAGRIYESDDNDVGLINPTYNSKGVF